MYYNINESASEYNFRRLDSFYAVAAKPNAGWTINGYADFLNTGDYNKSLSLKRAEAIKNYLLKKDQGLKIISCKGFGEANSKDNLSTKGDPGWRRADVFVFIPASKKIEKNQNTIQETVNPEVMPEENKITDLKQGESLALEGLSFVPGKHVVVSSAIPVMKELLQTLKDNPGLKIEIQGHVCCPGDGRPDGLDYGTGTYNLSGNRAKAIYNYLVENGIDKDRLTYKGYGRSLPKIKEEKSPEDEQVNRRVEIKILEIR